MHVVAAPDKFRGTATAADVAAAVADAVVAAGSTCTTVPLADGGEGTLEALAADVVAKARVSAERLAEGGKVVVPLTLERLRERGTVDVKGKGPMTSYLLIGGEVVWSALKNIARGKVFDENFLMSLATVCAFAIGEYPEAVAVMLFYQIGEIFQNAAVGRSRRRAWADSSAAHSSPP